MAFQRGDLVRVVQEHYSLKVDGYTIRVVDNEIIYHDEQAGEYIVPHPVYPTGIVFDPRRVEKV